MGIIVILPNVACDLLNLLSLTLTRTGVVKRTPKKRKKKRKKKLLRVFFLFFFFFSLSLFVQKFVEGLIYKIRKGKNWGKAVGLRI